MDAWPSVSVIIPARNSESTISEALDGVYGQEYPGPLEVVVADGSDDETMAQLIEESLSRGQDHRESRQGRQGWRRTARIEP